MSPPGGVWALEWGLAVRRRRLLAWNVAVPLLLLTPVAASPAAAPHRAAVFAVLIVLFGTFGACIPLVRDGASGWTEKLLLTGYGERAWLAERVGASAALDALQLLPLAGLLAATGAPAARALALVPGLLLALVAANLLGCLAAAAVRSLAEGALACAALALAALHLAGVFRTPAPGGLGALAERWSPFRPLHEALVAAARPGAAASGAGAAGFEVSWQPAAATAVLALLALGAAPWLARRLSRTGDG